MNLRLAAAPAVLLLAVGALAACSGDAEPTATATPGATSPSSDDATSPDALVSPSESASSEPEASATESGTAPSTVTVTGGRDADDDVAEQCAGVGVLVDVGDLDDDRDDATEDLLEAAEGAWCLQTDATTTAREALDAAGITTEGTTEFGDAVVCRVNGVPAADLPIPNPEGGTYSETCESMPAAFGYWAMWVRTADGAWGYAMEGADTQPLQPGETLGLIYTLNGSPATP